MKPVKICNTRYNNLTASMDNTAFDNTGEWIAVLLFTPDMAETHDHHHIELGKDEARRLRDFLNTFLEK
jgi:hypothetical protein